MNLKSVKLFFNSQHQLSQEKASSMLHDSTESESTNNNLAGKEAHISATNNFLVMFESEVKKYWGI